MICREELTQILCAQGVNQAGIDQIIADVDTDGNGQIDYREVGVVELGEGSFAPAVERRVQGCL